MYSLCQVSLVTCYAFFCFRVLSSLITFYLNSNVHFESKRSPTLNSRKNMEVSSRNAIYIGLHLRMRRVCKQSALFTNKVQSQTSFLLAYGAFSSVKSIIFKRPVLFGGPAGGAPTRDAPRPATPPPWPRAHPVTTVRLVPTTGHTRDQDQCI